MQKVGVEAVVEGLGAFIRDTGRMNDALNKIRPQGTLLMRAFEGITGSLQSFGREILNVVEHALGHLLAEAIQFVIQKLGELVQATIEAGAEFQTMQLRLERLNFNSLIAAGNDYKEAMRGATEETKEQLEWIQRLAVQTPYDFQDIANVFTLARSYSFTSGEAQQLTEDISNFAAGMGLGNVEIERIIVNFGQMVQQGKVTQRELNDLARGAFVPVNDIVARMGDNISNLANRDLVALSKATGLSVTQLQHMGDGTDEARKSLDKFRSSTEGVNAFMQAFSDVVAERFTGAAENMARTFSGATANAQDLIKSLLGFGVVRPVLDVLGARIADLVNSLTSEENWDNLTNAAERVGTNLARIFSDLFGRLPGTEDLADGIVEGLDRIADWLDDNRFKILKFFEGIGTAIQTKVVPFITKIIDAFNLIRAWVGMNGETIRLFFEALGNIIGSIFDFDIGAQGSFLENFLTMVKGFMEYVIANQDAIAYWAELILKAFLAFQVLATILTIVGGIIMGVIGFVLGLIAAIAGFLSVVSAVIAVLSVPLIAAFAVVTAGIAFIISMVVLAIAIFYAWRSTLTQVIATAIILFGNLVKGAQEKFGELFEKISTTIEQIKVAIREQPWGGIGRGIVDGITGGILKAAAGLAAAARRVVEQAIAAAQSAAGISSPSKEGIYIGEMTMMGISKGIEQGAKVAMRSMEEAVKMMALPAMSLPAITQQYAVSMPAGVSNTNSYTNNFNLTVNSGAPTEPIIQDYNMMQSLIQQT